MKINKILLTFATLVSAAPCLAQSNSFPSSGDVTIGSSLIVGNNQSTKFIQGTAAGGAIRLTTDYATFDRGISLGLMDNGLSNFQSVFEIDGYNNSLFKLGKVGIGTSSPSSKFEIEGHADGNRLLYINETDGSPVGQVARIFRYNNISGGGNHTNALLTLSDHSTNVPLHIESHSGSPLFTVFGSGKVGIGTNIPSHTLAVNGTIRAKEVIVDTGWSDFVFEDTYRLRSLEEVRSHIEEHGHLPDVPSAATVEAEGLSVGEAQKIMMQKIEELTLYMIEKDKQVAALQARVAELESK